MKLDEDNFIFDEESAREVFARRGYKLIKTCGKCKNLDGCPIFLLMLLGSDDQDRERLIKNFGCIDFKPKEGS